MRESEINSGSKQEQKDKIRKRYQKTENANVKVIPAKPQRQPFNLDQKCRVAVYARVSTDDPNQTSSYELQKNYYENMVQRNPNWELVGIYADEGISGTSLSHRDEFKRMIKDCMDDKIDLIITKSVSRFARNTEDCLHYIKQLAYKRPPTGVLFEDQDMYSLNENMDLTLTLNASIAQEESHIKSVSMNRSYEMRFSMFIFLTPVLLGYDHDDDGNLIINPDEARTVRYIFLKYLCGYSCKEIAEALTKLKRRTKIGNEEWSEGSISGILRNERHCGDVLARKTYTPNFLDHKSVKNNGEKAQYYAKDDHEAIVSREMFLLVQSLMDQAKYGYRNAMPGLKVIDSGVLKGFVQINPCWIGYSLDDYLNACQSVLSEADYLNPMIQIRKKAGEYDFRDFQVTREQFLSTTGRIIASISTQNIRFSAEALDELKEIHYVELLYHPFYGMLVVRPGSKNDKHSIRWSRFFKGKYRPLKIRGRAFLSVLYELSGWNKERLYTLTGFVKEQDKTKVLVFYAEEAEERLYENNKMSVAYKKEWLESFGDKYLKFLARTQAMFDPDKDWEVMKSGVVADDSKYHILPISEYEAELEKLQAEFESELRLPLEGKLSAQLTDEVKNPKGEN